MTPDQRTIYNFIRDNGTATTTDIVALEGGKYYCNAEKYIGDRLSRMVKAGMIERVKPGVFSIGSGKKAAKVVAVPVDQSQTTLF